MIQAASHIPSLQLFEAAVVGLAGDLRDGCPEENFIRIPKWPKSLFKFLNSHIRFKTFRIVRLVQAIETSGNNGQ